MLGVTSFTERPRPRINRNILKDQIWTLDKILLATRGRIILCPALSSRVNGQKTSLTVKFTGREFSTTSTLKAIHFRNISTDSRTIRSGDLFLALSGPNYDGTSFIADAIQKGAAGLLVNRSKEQEVLLKIKETPQLRTRLSLPVVLVEDTLQALGDLAAYHRSLMKNLKVIAITGSSGKTTVKEMTAAITSMKYNTLKSTGNFNNLIGLPLSLLQAQSKHEFAVLEMGMNQSGEIARLTDIADPDIGCIVNIQEAHLAGLKNIEGVAEAKNELFAGMKSWGKLIVNSDDAKVRSLARKQRIKQITYASTAARRRQSPTIKATHIKSLGEEGMTFTLHIGEGKSRVTIKTVGVHNVSNALAAAAIAHGAGMTLQEIVRGLSGFEAYDMRARIVTLSSLGLKIIDDSYNANPSSMQAALETLKNLKQNRQAVAVLGDMLELGDQEKTAHRLVGKTVARLGIDYLASTGIFAKEVVESARASGMSEKRARIFNDKSKITDWLRQLFDSGELSSGDWILVKGSRGMRMESLIEEMIKADDEQ